MSICGARTVVLPKLARGRFWHSRRRQATNACMYWLQTVYLSARDGLPARDAAWRHVHAYWSASLHPVTVWAAPRTAGESLAMAVSTLLAYRASVPVAVALLCSAGRHAAVEEPGGPWSPLVLELDPSLLEHMPAHWCLVLPGDNADVLETASQLAVEGMSPFDAMRAARALSRR